MWPWEHLAVGYLVYSLFSRWFDGRAPRGAAVVALAFGTQFPDLVDKPLAWVFGVLPSGYSLGHSIFVAAPLSLLAVAVGAAVGRRYVGTAFAVGYLSHLPGDVFYPVLVGGRANPGAVLWPVVSPPPTGTSVGLREMVGALFGRYLQNLFTAELSAYFLLEIGLLASVVLLWLYDGMPPLRALFAPVTEETH
ncbi:metal-dependent hydrolase [Halorussus salilacus]|uniref:metal-dependent hydrolase n=1 Tax=Halorussus salilacus TaxID=2953750 RepID=UPI0020A21C0B|nr:metal-dependent hydrolase [Halorussus salilacus]USZ68085.1 metal-dependent hydrolase [Halorussus salilacus]